jgi:hypothetical protein
MITLMTTIIDKKIYLLLGRPFSQSMLITQSVEMVDGGIGNKGSHRARKSEHFDS